MRELDKQNIRKNMLKQRLELDVSTYMSSSNLIMYTLENMEIFKQAKTVGIYASIKREVHTLDCIEKWCSSKKIAIPRVENQEMNFYQIVNMRQLSTGSFGVLEPQTNHLVQPEDLDLIIVPLVAYDKYNHRIGYGGGFYDRYLPRCTGIKIGIAFAMQEVDNIVAEAHDIPLDIIINENNSTIM